MSLPLPRGRCARSRGWMLSVLVPAVFLVSELTKLFGGSESLTEPPHRPVTAQTARSRGSPASAATASSATSARTNPKMIQGQMIYRQYCQRCHDEDGSGARTRARTPEIPNFMDESWQEKRSDAQLAASILDGKGTSMPAFGGQLSKDTARVLAAYVRELDPPSPGHVKPAESDFEKRFRQLQLEMEELQRQFDALTRRPKH